MLYCWRPQSGYLSIHSGGYPIAFGDFKAMADIDIEERELSRNYRSSERIIDYFGNFNVHATRIEAASGDKNYQSLVSFDETVSKTGLEAELIRLIRFNIETTWNRTP